MSSKQTKPEATIANHLAAFFRRDVDGVVADYADDAVFIVPNGPLHGRSEIRRFFAALIEAMPKEFWDAFKMRRQEIVGDFGYIVWDAGPVVQLGTDTFRVRDGKIVMQTFASYPPLSL